MEEPDLRLLHISRYQVRYLGTDGRAPMTTGFISDFQGWVWLVVPRQVPSHVLASLVSGKQSTQTLSSIASAEPSSEITKLHTARGRIAASDDNPQKQASAQAPRYDGPALKRSSF